ncbi:hypothetical protein ACFQPA_13650 [Halomarina halobia]|uniref:Uncharacterized protein n=1 Tax=Halomarina halobia TaxID=3033386 RepID=A0ABD6A8X5_9EURY|nr:hypothetical protein [Halomarina sp. PSR21]
MTSDADCNDSFFEDEEISKLALEEARRTVDDQIQTLTDIDSKAIAILRLDGVLLGLILTGLSIIARTDQVGFDIVANTYTIFGAVALLLSIASGALTYNASDYRAGISAADVVDLVEVEYTLEGVHQGLALGYAEFIEKNFRTNITNALGITLTIYLTVAALAFFVLGVVEAAVGVGILTDGAVAIGLLLLAKWSGMLTQFRRYWTEVRQYDPDAADETESHGVGDDERDHDSENGSDTNKDPTAAGVNVSDSE